MKRAKRFCFARYLFVEVIAVIERLMNLERPYGEPEYSRLSKEISKLKDFLCDKLDQDGRKLLEQLTDVHMQQETAILYDAFSDGFWTAVELMLEFEHRNQEGSGMKTLKFRPVDDLNQALDGLIDRLPVFQVKLPQLGDRFGPSLCIDLIAKQEGIAAA